MCGILGISSETSSVEKLYDGLATLQHRGQDAAGMLIFDGEHIHLKRGSGLVRDVFKAKDFARLKGNFGIGHVRYPTAGNFGTTEAQPFFINSPFGLGIAHNGNLTNTAKLRQELIFKEACYLNTKSDSEVLLNIFARELRKQKMTRFSVSKLFAATKKTMQRIKGSYAAVILIAGQGILAIRDPQGLRPLSFGKRQGHTRPEFAIASEDIALSVLDFSQIEDVKPGEAIWFANNGKLIRQNCITKNWSPCIFEYVYLARPDAKIDDVSVYRSRLRAGQYLAKEIKKSNLKIDVVVPVPDTSRAAAIALAEELGLCYREGLIKNRYIARTFIMSTQSKRQKSIRHKLIPLPLELKNKNVLLVDDSIVRGNTSRQIIELVRQAGARKVFFASASPPIKFPCVYGVDMPSKSEFIANGLSIDQIQKQLKADALFYLPLPDLKKICEFKSVKNRKFCTACFTGKYPTKISRKYLTEIEKNRAASRKVGEGQLALF
jgi:amidophosphoribosyltransferase